MEIAELRAFLGSLPDETTRQYEVELTNAATRHNNDETRARLRTILMEEQTEEVGYNAFYCLNIMYRRSKDFSKLNRLFEQYGERFAHHPTYSHLYSLFSIESDSFYDYNTILQATWEDAEAFRDNAGFVHLFADVFVTTYEKAGIHDPEKFIQDWYDKALSAVNRAIDLDPSYAKYYCTKARILCVGGEYEQAEHYVNHAIDYEDSQRGDYILRIQSYQYYRIMIKMRCMEQQFNTRLDELRRRKKAAPALREDEEVYPYTGDEPFVFVSYSHADSPAVNRVLALLQSSGVRLWFDKGGIPGDVDYTDHIATRIMDSSAVIFMVSSSSVKSEYARMEFRSAKRNGKPPVCLFLEDTLLSPGMRMEIDMCQQLLLYQMDDSTMLRLLLSILPSSTIAAI